MLINKSFNQIHPKKNKTLLFFGCIYTLLFAHGYSQMPNDRTDSVCFSCVKSRILNLEEVLESQNSKKTELNSESKGVFFTFHHKYLVDTLTDTYIINANVNASVSGLYTSNHFLFYMENKKCHTITYGQNCCPIFDKNTLKKITGASWFKKLENEKQVSILFDLILPRSYLAWYYLSDNGDFSKINRIVHHYLNDDTSYFDTIHTLKINSPLKITDGYLYIHDPLMNTNEYFIVKFSSMKKIKFKIKTHGYDYWHKIINTFSHGGYCARIGIELIFKNKYKLMRHFP